MLGEFAELLKWRLSFPVDSGLLYVDHFSCSEFLNEHLRNVTVAEESQLLSCCTQLFTRWLVSTVLAERMRSTSLILITWLSFSFYPSVTGYDKLNATLGGFSLESLEYCCKRTNPTNFNCSHWSRLPRSLRVCVNSMVFHIPQFPRRRWALRLAHSV